MFPERRVAMKIKSFLLVLIFALTLAMWTQDKPAQAPPGPGSGNQIRAEHRQTMMEMHKQEMEAMRADIEKMKSSLAQMKAVALTIRDPNELSSGEPTWICGKRWLPTWTECKRTWNRWDPA
jgi:hypothetical protein